VIGYRAPGKAVIWGEYAVLAGAPAMVMALDRYAAVEIRPGGDVWQCRARGFEASATVSAEDLTAGTAATGSAAGPLAAACGALGIDRLPDGADVVLDTRDFFAEGGAKLGIGSSAAICTAACAAVATLVGREVSFAEALTAHRLLQNSRGSGIDVAASFHGGVLRFQDGQPSPVSWPADLQYRFFWTGVSASTSSHLNTFARWRATSDERPLTRLGEACTRLFHHTDLAALGNYVDCLRAMDAEARLGIYTEPHERLHELAISRQVVYKPCGAGGGDIGIAFANEEGQQALEAFTRAATQLSFHPLSLEIAAHGIEPTR
jgi:phosphomevalonate kinase